MTGSRQTHTLGVLAEHVGGELRGDPARPIEWVGTLENAGPRQITFLHNSRYRRQLQTTRAGAVLLSDADADACAADCIVVGDPYLAYARIAALLGPRQRFEPGIHPSAVVSPDARIDPSAHLGPHCVVEAGAEVGARCLVGPGSILGRDTVLGDDCELVARVTVCHGTHIGHRALIQPGAVIGGDGFGFANDRGDWVRVPQLGRVRVGDDVEIGANTTIDRGTIDDTVIEDGVIIDNLVQVAHNVHVGAHSAVAGCVGIAGSTTIGRHCALGGGVGVSGHLEIVDNVVVTGGSVVLQSLKEPGVYSSGVPIEPNQAWHRNYVRFRKLDDTVRRVTALEKQVGTKERKGNSS